MGSRKKGNTQDNLIVLDIHHSLMLPYINVDHHRASESSCPAALGMEHLNEQAVAGYLSTQVFAVQVVFSERAERA